MPLRQIDAVTADGPAAAAPIMIHLRLGINLKNINHDDCHCYMIIYAVLVVEMARDRDLDMP